MNTEQGEKRGMDGCRGLAEPEHISSVVDRNLADLCAFALTRNVTDLQVLVEELKEIKINLSLELQAVRDQRVAEAREWRAFMTEQRAELDRIRADFRTDSTLLQLIEPPTGEKQWHDVKKKSSSQRSLRKKFASSTN